MMAKSEYPSRQYLFLFALVLAPFFLNDFAFMASQTAAQWLAADYGSKTVALVLLAAFAATRRPALDSLPRRLTVEGLLLAAVCTFAILAVDAVVGEIGDIFPQELILFRYPKIELPALYWIDLTFGLALTAVAEELVFRSIARDFLGRYMSSALTIIAASALIFAAIHWSHGIGAMVTALFAGAALMALFMRTGSVVPCMIAHYAVNAADFL
jgi:membrane protease YdiL (CAAX protease family)